MFSLLKSTVSKTCVINRVWNCKFKQVPVRESVNELNQSKGHGCLSMSKPKMISATRINKRNLLNCRETKMSKSERRKFNRKMIILIETVENNIKNKLLLDVNEENKTIEEEKFIASSPVEYRNLLKFLFDTMAENQDNYFEEPSTYEMIKMIVNKQETKNEDYDKELVVNYFFVRILFHLYFNSHPNFCTVRNVIEDEVEEMTYEDFAFVLTTRVFMDSDPNDAIILSLHKLQVNEIWRMIQDY